MGRVLGRVAWILARAIRVLRFLVFRILLSRILGLMTRILSGFRVRLLGLMTRILRLLRRSGRRSRWFQCGDAMWGWRGGSGNRGLPRGSRQRGGIPWLDGLLHDGTHHLAQPTSQPADFYLRPERPFSPPFLLSLDSELLLPSQVYPPSLLHLRPSLFRRLIATAYPLLGQREPRTSYRFTRDR